MGAPRPLIVSVRIGKIDDKFVRIVKMDDKSMLIGRIADTTMCIEKTCMYS